jgi:hypothetical protein
MTKRVELPVLALAFVALVVGMASSGRTTAKATDSVTPVGEGERFRDYRMPSASGLALVTAAVAASQAGQSVKANTHLGWLIGRVYVHHHPRAGAQVLVRPAHSKGKWTTRRALSSGRFAFRLLAGHYLVAVNRGGRLCDAQEMLVRRGQEARAVIACK